MVLKLLTGSTHEQVAGHPASIYEQLRALLLLLLLLMMMMMKGFAGCAKLVGTS
jgi:hypothetical protein